MSSAADLGPDDRFRSAREAYRSERNTQRVLIAARLRSAGFVVKTRGSAGRGLASYTSGRRLDPPFDLSGWMWVDAERDGVFVTVTLQVLDQDPHSGNIHALMDRIGVDVFREGTSYPDDDPLFEQATTGLELPLAAADLEELVAVIESRAAALSG